MRAWLRDELTLVLRRAAGHAMNEILQQQGVAVCDSGWGKHVAPGIFEFRIERDPQDVVDAARGRTKKDEPRRFLLRVFCHAHGNKLILLLAGYDKAADPSKKRQQAEIAVAKKRLAAWRLREARRATEK